MHYTANVKVVIAYEDRYLMEIRSEQEAHAPGVLCFTGGKVEDAGAPVLDIVFLGRYLSGDAVAGDPGEVGSPAWPAYSDVLSHPKCPPWTADSIRRAETMRRRLGWD